MILLIFIRKTNIVTQYSKPMKKYLFSPILIPFLHIPIFLSVWWVFFIYWIAVYIVYYIRPVRFVFI